jgi:hypothetical protein
VREPGRADEDADPDQLVRREYVAAVRLLADRAASLLAEGRTEEEVAREVHGQRRALSERFKARTTPGRRARLYERNLAEYGDPGGPTIEALRARGRTWSQIIASAARPGSAALPGREESGGPPESSGRGLTRRRR